jgi:hypothetical protein
MKARQSPEPKQSFIPRSERPGFRLGRQSRLNELQVRDVDVILGKKFSNERLKKLNDKSATPAVLDKGIEKTHRDGCDFLGYSFSAGQDLQCYFETRFPIASKIRKSHHGSVRFGTNIAGDFKPPHSHVELLEAAHFPAGDAAPGAGLESVVNNYK